MTDSTTIQTVNLELKMATVEGHVQKIAYMEDQAGVLHSIVFPTRFYAEAPPEVQAKYNESGYNVMVQSHYRATVDFVMDRMTCSTGMAHRIVRHLAGY